MFKVLLSTVRLCAITSFSCNFVLQNYHSPFICHKEYFIHLYEFIQLCSRSEHIISSHLLKCLLNIIRKLVQVKRSCREVFSFPTCSSSHQPSTCCSPWCGLPPIPGLPSYMALQSLHRDPPPTRASCHLHLLPNIPSPTRYCRNAFKDQNVLCTFFHVCGIFPLWSAA